VNYNPIKKIQLINPNGYFIVFSLIVIIVLISFTHIILFSALGIGISIYLILRLLFVIDYTIPVLEIMLLMAASQWIIGPLIDYNTEINHYKYYMYVKEQRYMGIVVPLFLVYTTASLMYGTGKILNREIIKDKLNKNIKLPIYLIIIGLLFEFTQKFMPASLQFFSYLTSYSLVGVGLLFFTKLKNKWAWTFIVFLPRLIKAINGGMFHELIIWCIFVFVFINLAVKLNLSIKIISIFISVILIFTLQSIKKQYRDKIYDSNYKGSKINLFFNMLTTNLDNENNLENEKNVNNVNTRINQGWIISKIIKRIPEKENYLGGTTVLEAIKVSLVPRFLMPNKSGGGGKKTFELLTGMHLNKKTAMGVSLIVQFFTLYQKKYAILFFLLPIVFLQVIKAETDLTTVLNHITKSLMFVYIVMVGLNRGLKLKI